MNDDFNLEKIADELTKRYGQIPQVCENTYLCSISVYGFKLDENLLRIQDYDVIKLKDDWPMKKGDELTIKTIRKSEKTPFTEIHKGEKITNYQELIDAKNTIDNPEVFFKEIDGNYLVSAVAKSDVTLCCDCTYALHLLYDTKMSFDGKNLAHSVAIQPLDYQAIKTSFGLVEAKKVIRIEITSKKNFSTFAFSGSTPIFSPEIKLATEEHGIYLRNWVFEARITNLDRAKYFTVCAFLQ